MVDPITFFPTPASFRKWLRRNHATVPELWVGYYKKQTGKPSLTWPESVDEALCFGWIDGIRKSIDAESYRIRFTPRRRASIWSAVNIKRVQILTNEKRMQPAGRAAFAARVEKNSGIYAYEQRSEPLPDLSAAAFKKNRRAWAFFEAQPPFYRKTISWWIVSAKQEDTRQRRLQKLIAASARGERLR